MEQNIRLKQRKSVRFLDEFYQFSPAVSASKYNESDVMWKQKINKNVEQKVHICKLFVRFI